MVLLIASVVISGVRLDLKTDMGDLVIIISLMEVMFSFYLLQNHRQSLFSVVK